MTLENPRLVMTDWSWIARLGGQLSDIIQKMPEAAEYSRQLADHKVKADNQYKEMVDYINDPAKTPDAVIEALGVTRNELAKTVPKARKNVDPREFTGTLASWFEPLALKVKDVSPDVLLSWVPKAPGDVANAPRISESVTAMKKLDEQNRIGQTTEAAMTPETTLTPTGRMSASGKPLTEIGATAAPQTREQFQGRFAEMAKPSAGGGQPIAPGFDAPASRPGLRPETTQTAVENNPQFAATQAGLPTQAAVAGERYRTTQQTNLAEYRDKSLADRAASRATSLWKFNQTLKSTTDKELNSIGSMLATARSSAETAADRASEQHGKLMVSMTDVTANGATEDQSKARQAELDRLTSTQAEKAMVADNLDSISSWLMANPDARKKIDKIEMGVLIREAERGKPFDAAAFITEQEMLSSGGASGRTAQPAPTAEKKDGLGIRGLLGKTTR